MSEEVKICAKCKSNFTIDEADFDYYKKISVPPPTFCPECRRQRRMTWRNERTFYRRNCDLCKKSMLTMYAPADAKAIAGKPDQHRLVYCHQCWFSDKWSPLEYGQTFDPTRPFFTQFKELLDRVPLPNLSLTNSVNSDYCNYTLDVKNSYLLFGAWACEDSYYSQRVVRCTNVCDSMWLTQDDLMYDAVYCTQSKNLTSAFDSHTSRDSTLLEHCRETSNCLGCINLRNQSYYIFNEPYSKEEYAEKVKSFNLGSYASRQELLRKFSELSKKSIHPATVSKQTVNSTGDMLRSCRNCKECFLSSEGEDSAYCIGLEKGVKDCYDVWVAQESLERCYEIIAGGANNQGSKFGVTLYQGCGNLEYCFTCMGSHNSFGCVGFKQNKYCILNKEYSKEDYEKITAEIRTQMNDLPYKDAQGITYGYGEFFPSELSPFRYNESLAQEWFPFTRENALAQGFQWKEPEVRNYTITKQTDELPDDIKDVPDSITQDVIACEHTPPEAGKMATCHEQCATAFKITPADLALYRRLNLPLPRLCPNCRHYQRIARQNPFTLFSRTCAKCNATIQTTYAPDREEIVYCEACYQTEVA